MDALIDVQHLRKILGYPPHDCHVEGLFAPPMRLPPEGDDILDTDHHDPEDEGQSEAATTNRSREPYSRIPELPFDSQMTRMSFSQPLTEEV
jgi:hypothetical protein